MSNRFKLCGSAGFTLIELLIVISIIGILAGVLFVSIGQTPLKKARDSKRLNDMVILQKALQLYQNENGSLPDETSSPGLGGWEVSFQPDFMEYLRPYLSGIPADPLNTVAGSFDFFSPRPDGSFYYTYYNYPSGSPYGCPWSGPFSVLAFRSVEAVDSSSLSKTKCGPQPCPGGGTPGVCRDWSTEFDYSLFILP